MILIANCGCNECTEIAIKTLSPLKAKRSFPAAGKTARDGSACTAFAAIALARNLPDARRRIPLGQHVCRENAANAGRNGPTIRRFRTKTEARFSN
jgi:hypothetical protein